MSPQWLWSNLLAYSLQVGVLVGLAGIVPVVARMSVPRVRLLFLQAVLALCILLPAFQPFRHEAVAVTVTMDAAPLPVQTGSAAARRLPLAELALGLVALGIVLRAGWLGLGLLRLRGYRRQARDLDPVAPEVADLHAALAPRARLCVSGCITSPVTFGVLRPVVLLPERFASLGGRVRTAVACHELLHVARRDWLFTVVEEAVRAALWFHPAVWWLLGEIQLSREQAVDREVVAITQARDEYVDALLAVSGAPPALDLAPAPLFLRRRHLQHRVVSILKEGSMSRIRLFSALAVAAGVLAAGCWLAVATFPLQASPQAVADADGVSVDTGGAVVAHRAAVRYPEAARSKGVQGTVVVEAEVNDQGEVTDARVVAGPAELRASALSSVLEWHFSRTGGAGVRQVTIAFRLPAAGAPQAEPRKPGAISGAPQADPEGGVLRRIDVVGLTPAAAGELLARLPVHEGDAISKGLTGRVAEAARAYDEHLYVWLAPSGTPGEFVMRVSLLPATRPEAAGRLRVGGNAQAMREISKPRPVYPVEAKQAGLEGRVRLQAVIGADGKVSNLQVVSGEPIFAQSAMDAVRQWVYEPTLVNGKPVEVITDIDVNYTLAK